MNTTVNEEVRRTAKAQKIPLWAIAERMGISEPTMTRRMRHELSSDERQRILKIIAEIAADSGTE